MTEFSVVFPNRHDAVVAGLPPSDQPGAVAELDREQVVAEELVECRQVLRHGPVDAHAVEHGTVLSHAGGRLSPVRRGYGSAGESEGGQGAGGVAGVVAGGGGDVGVAGERLAYLGDVGTSPYVTAPFGSGSADWAAPGHAGNPGPVPTRLYHRMPVHPASGDAPGYIEEALSGRGTK